MVKKRVIPCLDVAEGRVVKGVRFENLREMGKPVELARRSSFEAVWGLVVDGDLSSAVEPDRTVAADVWPLVDAIVSRIDDPVVGLRALLPLVVPARPTLDLTPLERRADALRVAAVVPTLLAALHRRMHGLDVVEPEPPALEPAEDLSRMADA